MAVSFFTLNLKRIGTLSSTSAFPDGLILELFGSSKSSINLIALVSDTEVEEKAEKVIMFLRCSLN